ncbi:MAG: 16S rRNA (uracil(1498)-N(3))-methyltransferase [Thiomicrorhabdus chilensis]|uniref:16S rRNA (uracil(1498)-N(3))-methyltransferase n=1 Tax=Thiomicrorhabdus chilensis TaxID=63656 RepID=UPI00299F0CC4|nr:16S rRNA (uracil(1498)-N(3))-methyltransferase [Thiomicrorhabdus chilensis]MDX1347748.1 16S rRNA (uracil(1498)-N(3))-methyltransferase [Thiomicrorhabdus chilensis]
MRIPRFYLPGEYQPQQVISLHKEQVHYALNVLRLKNQHPVEIFNGQGLQASATLIVTGRRSADLCIETLSQPQNESPLHSILVQSISRGDRMDYSLQKSVELGVTQIQPIFSERCEVKLSGDKLKKRRDQWQAIVISACEQSGRCTVPEILPIQPYADWLSSLPQPVFGLVLDPYASNTLQTLQPPKTNRPVHLLIGPEGGLSTAEVEQAVNQGLTPIKLGPRILRTETAGPAILAGLQTLWGDW